MEEAAAEKLSQVQQRAGDRYRAMIFYQNLCEVMAWINLGLGGLTFLICLPISVSQEESGTGMALLGYGFLALLAGFSGFLTCKIVANFIKGFVDIAVNSHLQVYLLSQQRSSAK